MLRQGGSYGKEEGREMPMCRRILILALMFLPASAFAGETCLDYDEADRVRRASMRFQAKSRPNRMILIRRRSCSPRRALEHGIHLEGPT